MPAHQWCHGIRKANPLHDFSTHYGVGFHFFKFFRRESARFRDNVFRNGKLTNVMQQCGRAQRLKFSSLQAQFPRHADGVGFYPLQMIVRGLVFSLNRKCERLNGAPVQRGHFERVSGLFPGVLSRFLQAINIAPVRAVNNVENRQ